MYEYYKESNKDSLFIEEGNNELLEIKLKLKKEIDNLPENQKNVIYLFYMEEYSLKEISKELHIAIGTAKSRLFHAREKLKTLFKNKNYE